MDNEDTQLISNDPIIKMEGVS
uniref:Uncharacterized protein n=1 Tax=Lepeophtheirus salmonis TaxID=72036 RepID=A0A0K2TAJ3_LEPSM